jgi:hypothetical protein
MEIDPADGPRTQHYYFAHQYLRERAQGHPALLIEELRKETALRYLGFLWISRGMALIDNEDDFIPPKGLRCFPIDIGRYYGALVQFPTPQRVAEAYFVAVLLPIWEDDPKFCEFYTLEFTPVREDRPNGTILGKWQGGSHFNFGAGPPPDKEAFLDALEERLSA